jgi:hypothetical protein
MKNISLGIFICIFCLINEVSAQLYQSCDRWGNYTTGGYTIYNNIWGSRKGSQCLTVFNYNNWYVDANFAASRQGGIKSYPNVEKKVNLFVDNMGSVSSTFSVTTPASGDYNAAYDIWYNNYAYEIMLWMNYNGNVGPIASSYACNGACPEVTNVSIGGHTWNVYKGSNGSNEVFSFIRTSKTNSGTVDITAISQWIRARGWFANVNLHSIQLGFEITSTVNTQRFSINNFSVTEPAARLAISTNSNTTNDETSATVSASPNPVKETTTLFLGEQWIGGKASVINMTGQVLVTDIIKERNHELNLAGLPSGFLAVHISKGSRKAVLKIMKE